MDNAQDPEYDPAAQYCGPGRATIAVDPASNYICFQHDKEYGKMGPLSYVFSSGADSRFIARLWNNPTRSRGATSAMALFALKKIVMPINLDSFGKGMGKHYFPSMPREQVKRMKLMGEIRRYGRWKHLNDIRSRVMSPAKIARHNPTSWIRSGRVMPIGPYGQLRPRSRIMPFRNPMAYGYRKRKGYSRYGRRFSKYRRYGSRRSRFVRSVKKIAKRVVDRDSPVEAVLRRGFYGITGGVYGTGGDGIQIPNVNRQVAWGSTFYGNRTSMNNAYNSTGMSAFSNELRAVELKAYSEKHTIQNTCLFPVVLTVYKHYFPRGWDNIAETNDLLNVFADHTAESAWYGTTELVDNSVFDGTIHQQQQSAAISELWKANLVFNAPLPTWVTEGLRSFVVATPTATLGMANLSTDNQICPAMLVRPFGMIKFKIPQLENVKFYKQKVIILAPGQQYSVGFKKKYKRLDFQDIGAAAGSVNTSGLIHYYPGACGYTFEAHGLMSHDTTVGGTGTLALPNVARSTFSLSGEVIVNYQFKNNDIINNSAGKSTSLYTIGGAVVAEGRAGVQMEETTLN